MIGLDLNTNDSEICNLLCLLNIDYNDAGGGNTIDNKSIISHTGDNYINYKSIRYQLNKIEIKIPTQHRLDGVRYDAEIVFVHKSIINKDVLRVSVLLEVTENTTTTDHSFKEIMENIPNKNSNRKVPVDIQLNTLLPDIRSFYNYTIKKKGSRPKTHYIVFDNVNRIYFEYFRKIKRRAGTRGHSYKSSDNISLYYNKNGVAPAVDEGASASNLHFVKCRKVRKTYGDKGGEEVVKVILNLPKGLENGLRDIFLLVAYIATFIIVILAIKLINRSCGVENFTKSLKSMWGKASKIGKKGVDAVRRRRSGR